MSDFIKPYVFDCGEDGEVYVSRQCPKCGRFIKARSIAINTSGFASESVRFDGWTCRQCGNINPKYDWM